MIADVLRCTIGRLSLIGDILRPILLYSNKKIKTHEVRSNLNEELDKTGIIVDDANPLEILYKDNEVIFVQYNSLAQSFWRSQEFSLVSKYCSLLEEPILDFGCGDGSFSSVLFPEIDFGVDIDEEALNIAKGYGFYRKILSSSCSSIPLNDSSVNSVFSNSVLEHIWNPEQILTEIHRVLVNGGTFMFTIVLSQFERDVAKFFGEKEGRRINEQFFHRNLWESNQWKNLLERIGFSVIYSREYQPSWFTFWYMIYRLFGEKAGLGRFFPGIGSHIWKQYKGRILAMVRYSIHHTGNGGNLFIVGKKRAR